jgi:hypothetical protein
MKTQETKINSLLIFLFIITVSQAQNVIPAAGGSVSGSGGSVSYTVGQIAYTTQTGLGGSVAQGIQQAYEIIVVTGVEETEINLQCVAYPNPVNETLKLKIDRDHFELVRYQLYDVSGQLLMENKVEGQETTILMDQLAPASYFLKVIDDTKEIKIFKIIKN